MILTVNIGCLGHHRASVPPAVPCNVDHLCWGRGYCSFGFLTFGLQSMSPRKTSSSSCRGSPLKKIRRASVSSSVLLGKEFGWHKFWPLWVLWLVTWLFSNHSSVLACLSWGSRAADTATFGARQQWLTVVLTRLAVTGMLLRQVLLCGPFQVELLQSCTLHFLNQLIQRAQLKKTQHI